MNRRTSVLIIFFMAMLLQSCAIKPKSHTYVNEKFGISITGPEGWYMLADEEYKQRVDGFLETMKKLSEMIEAEAFDIKDLRKDMVKDCNVVFSKNPCKFSPKDLYNPQVSFGCDTKPDIPPNASLIEYMRNTRLPPRDKIPPGYLIEEPHEISMKGMKGTRFISSGGRLEVFIFEKGILYTFIASCKKEELSRYLPLFEETINSFEIRK